MQTFTCFSFFICAFIIIKRANVVYPKIFDVFVSDWLKFLINIHKKIVALVANQAGKDVKRKTFWRSRSNLEDSEKTYHQGKRRPTTTTEGKSRFAKNIPFV